MVTLLMSACQVPGAAENSASEPSRADFAELRQFQEKQPNALFPDVEPVGMETAAVALGNELPLVEITTRESLVVTLCAGDESQCLVTVDGRMLKEGIADNGVRYTVIVNSDRKGETQISDENSQFWTSIQPTHDPEWLQES
ncbi:MAG: hypothetical protein ACK5MT_07485 [Actinomycetales bacterium]